MIVAGILSQSTPPKTESRYFAPFRSAKIPVLMCLQMCHPLKKRWLLATFITAMLLQHPVTVHAGGFDALLRVGMTRENVLRIKGTPLSKIELETSRIEKWIFSEEHTLVFKEGRLIGKQNLNPLIPYYKQSSNSSTNKNSHSKHSSQTHKVTSKQTGEIFKEIEGTSEPEGPQVALPPQGATQLNRRQATPQPNFTNEEGDGLGEDR